MAWMGGGQRYTFYLAMFNLQLSVTFFRRGPSVHEMDIGEQLEKIQSEGEQFAYSLTSNDICRL
jgi:hypothetical protein